MRVLSFPTLSFPGLILICSVTVPLSRLINIRSIMSAEARHFPGVDIEEHCLPTFQRVCNPTSPKLVSTFLFFSLVEEKVFIDPGS